MKEAEFGGDEGRTVTIYVVIRRVYVTLEKTFTLSRRIQSLREA